MDLITYISLFLSYQFVFSKVNKRQKFVIEKDKSVEFGLQHIEQFKAESVISCATQCRAFVNCCSASYDDFERNCSLYSCCFPKTLTSVGVKYIRISPNKGLLILKYKHMLAPSASIVSSFNKTKIILIHFCKTHYHNLKIICHFFYVGSVLRS